MFTKWIPAVSALLYFTFGHNTFAQQVQTEQFFEVVPEQHSSCNPQPSNNPILLLISAIEPDLSSLQIRDIPGERTDNCSPSKLVWNPKSLTDMEVYTAAFAVSALIHDTPAPKDCPPGYFGSEFTIDCLVNVDVKSLKKFEKPLFSLSALRAFGVELAKYSYLVRREDLKAVKHPGDEIVYLWPKYFCTKRVNDKTDGDCLEYSVLVTKATPDALYTLGTAAGALLPNLRAVLGLAFPGPSSFLCNASGFSPRPYVNPPSGPELYVSLGVGADLRRGPSTQDRTSTIRLQAYESFSYIVYESSPTAPVPGSVKNDFISFSDDAIKRNLNPFTCYGRNLNKVLTDLTARNFLNNSKGSTFISYLLYLNAVYKELENGKIGSSVAELYADDGFGLASNLSEREQDGAISDLFGMVRSLEDYSPMLAMSQLSCETKCDDGDFRCLSISFDSSTTTESLAELFEELNEAPPFSISSARLGVLFDIPAGDESLQLRGPTDFYQNGNFENTGLRSKLTAPITGTLSLDVEIPSKLGGLFEQQASGGSFVFVADFEQLGFSPFVRFTKEVWQNTYGGHVRRVHADNKRAVVTTETGCMRFPLEYVSPLEAYQWLIGNAAYIGPKALQSEFVGFAAAASEGKPLPDAPPGDYECSCLSCPTVTCCSGGPMRPSFCSKECEYYYWAAEEDGSCNSADQPSCICDY